MKTDPRLQPGEHIGKIMDGLTYLAACPTCGLDAKFTDSVTYVMSATSTARTIITCDIQCDNCPDLEIEVEDV